MSRRAAGGFASRKPLEFPRRSCRERQAVYMSLDENFLLSAAANTSLFRSLVNEANASRNQINGSFYMEPKHLDGYPTRSKDRYVLKGVEIDESPLNANSDDEEDAENNASRHRNRRQRKSKRNVLSDRLRESESPEEACETDDREVAQQEISAEQEDEAGDVYENVKQRRRHTGGPTRSNPSSRSSRARNRQVVRSQKAEETAEPTEMSENGTGRGDDVEDYEEVQKGYSLRTHRAPVMRFCIEQRPARRYLLHRDISHSIRKSQATRPRRSYRDGYATRSSSSNSELSLSEDECDLATKKRNGYGEGGRQKFLPLNYTESGGKPIRPDLHDIVRRGGTSCVDTDAMTIDRSVDFSKVGGLDHHIQSLKEIVLFPMLYPDLFSQFNVTAPKGVLFYGPPGTGKTLVARALANVCSFGERKVAFFMRKGGDCFSKFFGESEKRLRILFQQAYEMRPSIIFFDEIDGLAPARNSQQDMAHCTVVSTLLSLMDGLSSRGEVIVIGATNRPDALDPALRRPGRFDRELRFSLPDASARRAIIKINTSSWKSCQPSEEDLDWLASETAGYCGADLKFLCTEAVLVAVRSQLPQMYSTDKKLEVDPNSVEVVRKHFAVAMQRLVPAGRRDLSVPSVRMCDRVAKLLKGTIDFILSDRIPVGYRSPADNKNFSDVERIIRCLEPPPTVSASRLLLFGNSGLTGQTSYVLPLLVSRLDHLPVISLSIANLYTTGLPEANFTEAVRSAVRVAFRGSPCILLIPSIDIWQQTVSQSLWHLLTTALNSFTGFTPILLIASAERPYDRVSDEIKALFRPQNAYEIVAPSDELRRSFFSHVIVDSSLEEPKVFDPADYPDLPVISSSKPVRQYTTEELKSLKRMHDSDRVQLNLHYEESLLRLLRDKRFHAFEHAVDADEVPDYYTHIKNPMDLTTMLQKADKYKTPEEFLSDFELIYKNAVDYNPTSDAEGRNICNTAKLLYEFGKRAFYELDLAFLEKLDDMKRILLENGIDVNGENVGTATLESSESHVEAEAEKPDAAALPTPVLRKKGARRSGKKRRGSKVEAHPTEKSRRVSYQPAVTNDPQEAEKADTCSAENLEETKRCDRAEGVDIEEFRGESDDSLDSTKENPQVSKQHDSGCCEIASDKLPSPSPPQPFLTIDQKELNDVVDMALKKTAGWPLVELENLAAGLMQKIEAFRDLWDRSQLPGILAEVVRTWEDAHLDSFDV